MARVTAARSCQCDLGKKMGESRLTVRSGRVQSNTRVQKVPSFHHNEFLETVS